MDLHLWEEKIVNSVGPYSLQISGENYHLIGSLLPPVGELGRFIQLQNFYTDNELQNRMNLLNSHDGNPIGIDASVVEGLHSMLDEINSYVQVFQNARDMLRNQNVSNLQVQIICARGDKQYIQPAVNEVAAILIGEDSGHITHRDIVVVTRDGNLKRIKETYPSYMSLQYPLLFPYGIDGWRCGIKFSRSSSKKRQFVSIREFYAFRIKFQYNKGHTLRKGVKLFQQFVVDC